MILADTDVLIDYLSGISPVREQLTRLIGSRTLQTTAVSCFEVLSGAGDDKQGDAARALIEDIPLLPLDRRAAQHAAIVRRQLDRAGQKIDTGDSLIAGIALANDLPLLTRNRRHFSRVPNLKLVEIQKV
jgi:predicted nucleic acid-binding protein